MIEIERKFLIDATMLPGCLTPTRIAQGYLNQDPDKTVRIRIAGDKGFITIKGKSSDNGLSRYEWEKEIDLNDAKDLLGMCSNIIDKSRYHMIHQGKLWEIDVFHGLNEGLVVAEIELTSETELFNLPEWITQEVTGNPDYYNSNLAVCPFKWWFEYE
jgi:CYTH domain-containing protein